MEDYPIVKIAIALRMIELWLTGIFIILSVQMIIIIYWAAKFFAIFSK